MALTKVTSGLISADASSVDLNIDAGTLYIDSTNNRVGIGTTSPSRLLETVATNAGADITALQVRNNDSSTSTSTSIRFVNSTSGTSTAGGSEITSIRNSNDGGSLVFKTATDSTASLGERARIDSSGNVGIGTSSPADTYSYGKALDIQSSTGGAVYMRDTADTTKFGFTSFDGTTDRLNVGTGGTGTYLRFITAGDERVRITSTGAVYAYSIGYGGASSDVNYNTSTGEIFVVSSSQRYKENISEYTDSVLEKVNNLVVKSFDYKEGGYTNQIGLIAEEVEEQIPYLVNKKEIEGYDEPQPDSVKYSQLSIFLLKAIQELKSELDDAKARIQTLENA